MKNNLYTAELAGQAWDKDKVFEMVIITKWKDRTNESSEEGHKTYYFSPDFSLLVKQIKNEDWCKEIYENYPQYTKF